MSRIKRDLWNVMWAHVPSRRLRMFAARRTLGHCSHTTFVGMHTEFLAPAEISIEDRSVVNPHCILDGRGGPLTIQEDVDIGTHTHIWTLEHDPNSDTHGTKGGPVVIKHHTWIASRVTILPGVTIHEGAVVAAGSVVTSDIKALSIVGGVPARHIGWRNNSMSYRLNYRPRFR